MDNRYIPRLRIKKCFFVLHINARSVASKIDDLHILIMQLPVMVLALTETWLTEDNENKLGIPGYTSICTCKSRKDRIGGGVALLIREDIVYYPFNDSTLLVRHSYESIFINVSQIKNQDLIIGAIYRPSGQPLRTFNEEFAELIPALTKGNRKVLGLL